MSGIYDQKEKRFRKGQLVQGNLGMLSGGKE
jgi:hypothetical protein